LSWRSILPIPIFNSLCGPNGRSRKRVPENGPKDLPQPRRSTLTHPVMAGFGEIQRRAIIPLVGLALVGCYLMIYRPFARHAAALDTPVHKSWTRLATSLEQTNSTSIDFVHITNQLNDTRQALATSTRPPKGGGAAGVATSGAARA